MTNKEFEFLIAQLVDKLVLIVESSNSKEEIIDKIKDLKQDNE